MKKQFIAAEMEIIFLQENDVITTSGDPSGEGEA